MKQEPEKQSVDVFSFTDEKLLGEGNFGKVTRYQYNGSNPVLKALTEGVPGKYLVAKEYKLKELSSEMTDKDRRGIERKNLQAKEAYDNEIQITRYLQENPAHVQQPLYAQGTVVELGKEKTLIVSELIYVTKNQTGELSSRNLNEYLNGLRANTAWRSPAKKDQPTFLPGMLANFAQNIHTSQSQLHEQGVLHLDTALRNFMVSNQQSSGPAGLSLRIIDFGLSRIPNPEQNAVRITAAKSELPLMPIIRYDVAAAIPRVNVNDTQKRDIDLSIHTDLFAKKITLMEMACALMNKDEVKLLSKDPSHPEQNVSFRRKLTDAESLTHFFKNLEAFVKNVDIIQEANEEKGLPEIRGFDTRKAPLTDFIQSFNKYMTQMPDKNLSAEEIRREDATLFQEAMRVYEQVIEKNSSLHESPQPTAGYEDGASSEAGYEDKGYENESSSSAGYENKGYEEDETSSDDESAINTKDGYSTNIEPDKNTADNHDNKPKHSSTLDMARALSGKAAVQSVLSHSTENKADTVKNEKPTTAAKTASQPPAPTQPNKAEPSTTPKDEETPHPPRMGR